MRRLHGGWLAAPLLLLLTACGVANAGGTDDATPVTEIQPAPAIIVERGDPVLHTARAGDLRVLVVGVDGPRAPGFDAAISTLLDAPGTAVVAVTVGGESDPAALTMSGYPVRALPDGIGDILDGADARPALVVVGMTPQPADGGEPSALSIAGQAVAAGIPAVVLTVDPGVPDYAVGALHLRALFDHGLDELLARPAVVVTAPDRPQAIP